MRSCFVPQQNKKQSQCGALARIVHAVGVQKNKHVEQKPLAHDYKSQ
jgi:hypothetical protein